MHAKMYIQLISLIILIEFMMPNVILHVNSCDLDDVKYLI